MGIGSTVINRTMVVAILHYQNRNGRGAEYISSLSGFGNGRNNLSWKGIFGPKNKIKAVKYLDLGGECLKDCSLGGVDCCRTEATRKKSEGFVNGREGRWERGIIGAMVGRPEEKCDRRRADELEMESRDEGGKRRGLIG
jgi:hypothetical protein